MMSQASWRSAGRCWPAASEPRSRRSCPEIQRYLKIRAM